MRLEDVTFQNGDTTLSGQVYLPEAEGPSPAVAIVEGSGTVGLDNPYLARLADLFTSTGFAVMAWSKPGSGNSTGSWAEQTFNDRAAEAIAAVNYLRTRPDIQADAVGLWGGSQGGWVAPLAASLSKDVAFVIAVSGPGISPAEQELFRVGHELRADGYSAEVAEQAVNFYSSSFEMLRHTNSLEDILSALPFEQLKKEEWFSYLPELDQNEATFMKGIMDYDPRPALRSVTCPFLGIWGETDQLVPALLSAEIFGQELTAGGNEDFTLKIFADADHGIFVSETGSRKEAALRRERDERFLAPGYLDLMKNWLSDRFAPVPAGSL